MKHRFQHVRAMTAATGLLLALTSTAAIAPVDLRCEYAVNPVGVDTASPRLFWKLDSPDRGARQTAYHVLVATTAAKLASDTGDLWDSGRVASDAATHIHYAGQPLESSQQVFWKVRAWDQNDKSSSWSAGATWTMGVLSSNDWKARWITRAAPSGPVFDGANWIWHAERAWTNAAGTLRPPNVAGGATRYFQRTFNLPAERSVKSARLLASIDNTGEVWLNGARLAQVPNWEQARMIDGAKMLRRGVNLLAVRALNTGTSVSPAGCLLKLVVEYDDGSKFQVVTDAAWASSEQAGSDDWQSQADTAWPKAVVLAPWGQGPWKQEVKVVAAAGLPLLRKEFQVRQPVQRAVVHVSGLGHFDLFLDGQKVGDHFLDPAWTVYEKTAAYVSFDVTQSLRPGAHVFGVMLGKGFYNTAGDRRVHGVNASRPLKLILQAHVTYADGTEESVVSDASWRTAEGPITHSAILGGEDYDARTLPRGWDQPGFNDASWTAAVETHGPGGALTAAYSPPLKLHDVFKPVRIDEPQPGVFVYDFGQNASAVPRLRVRGASGQTLRLTPAEQRHGMSPRRNDGKGLVNPAGVGHPNHFEYTLRGGAAEEWTPQFTYSGFQYLQLEGAVPQGQANPEGKPVVEELLSVHVRNAAPSAGRFECSNPMFNAIDRIIDWAVRANLSHVLTDCPHREKLGWLEVAYLMGPSIAGRYDIARFYSKVSRDCADSQSADGLVPTVAPAYPAFAGGFAYTPEWGAAAVVVPWLVYQWYGDRDVLATNYATMKAFVDYMKNTSKDLVPRAGLGDWYDYGHGKPVGASQFTPIELSAMATFSRCARIVADTARRLHREDDARRYEELAAQIKAAFNQRYFDGNSEYKNLGSPQAANSMALVTDLVPAASAAAVRERIIQDLRTRGNQQTAGDIAHWYLLQALATAGRSDVIHDMTARTNMGSYGFIVQNGWNSMPEAWDANTGASMNHCMLGHIQEWFLGWVAGIRPDPEAPGFRRFVIHPQPVGDLTWARAHYDSLHGRIVSEWKKTDRDFTLDLVVPANTRARVILPAEDVRQITEGGKSIEKVQGITVIGTGTAARETALDIHSGRYRFVAHGKPGALK